jgi:hypothetical protein
MDLVTQTWMESRNLRLDDDEVFTYLSVLIALGRGAAIPEGLWVLLVSHPRFWITTPGIH